MAVPTLITDLSATIASNVPAGSEARTTADDYIRALSGFVAQLRDGPKDMALGSASAPSICFTGDTNTGIYSQGANRIGITTDGTVRVEVSATGAVGVGVVPSAFGTGYKSVEVGYVGCGIYSGAASNIFMPQNLWHNGTDHKYASSSLASGIYLIGSGAHSWYSAPSGTAGNTATLVALLTLSAATGNLVATGDITAFSDERLKTDFTPMDVDVKALAAIEISEFTRTDTGARQFGVTAQDLQKVMPQAVHANADGILSVDYGRAALIAAIALAKRIQ